MRNNMKAVVSALVSGIIALLTSILTAFQGQNAGFETITDGQWVTAVLAFFVGLGVTGGVTYRVRNEPAPPRGG
jgi:TRAP-type C4-dicarboxylate transport system permease large subunit